MKKLLMKSMLGLLVLGGFSMQRAEAMSDLGPMVLGSAGLAGVCVITWALKCWGQQAIDERLLKACESKGTVDAVKLLLKFADPNACDRETQTSCLRYAVKRAVNSRGDKNTVDIVALLLESGADLQECDTDLVDTLLSGTIKVSDSYELLRLLGILLVHGGRTMTEESKRVLQDVGEALPRELDTLRLAYTDEENFTRALKGVSKEQLLAYKIVAEKHLCERALPQLNEAILSHSFCHR